MPIFEEFSKFDSIFVKYFRIIVELIGKEEEVCAISSKFQLSTYRSPVNDVTSESYNVFYP